MLTMILPLLAAATLSEPDNNLLEQRVVAIFAPYAKADSSTPSWDYPIYSTEVTELIAHWRRVTPANEPDALSEGDWLCQCQDWDESAFTATMGERRVLSDDRVEVDVAVDLGFGGGPESVRQERLVFKREGEGWQVDDLFAPSFPDGLKQALRATIAEEEGVPAGERG